MASCSDDSKRECTPNETRLCAGVGRCQGVEACLPDGSGWGECDCSGPPRPDGTGGTGNEVTTSSLIGRACTEDAQCGGGLTCFTSNSNAFFGGGPPNGYCTLNCDEDAQCSAIDRASSCFQGMCLRTCRSLPQSSLGDNTRAQALQENKCLGRMDLACNSEAFLGISEFSGLRQAGWCIPQCGSDDDCPGRSCDLARGVCVDTPTAGLPIGARCANNGECSGGLCVFLSSEESFCSAPCVFGQPAGCGYGLSASPRGAGCILPQVRGFLSTEGAGDMGLCGELCSVSADCTQTDRGWTCEQSSDTASLFNTPGLCDAPTPVVDAGVDGGSSPDASTGPTGEGDAG